MILRERVARAIYATHATASTPIWENLLPAIREYVLKQADAAIKVILSATPEELAELKKYIGR